MRHVWISVLSLAVLPSIAEAQEVSAQEAAVAKGRIEVFGTPRRGHYFGVTGVEYRADGKQFLSSSFDGTIGLWDALTGERERAIHVSDEGVWRGFYYDEGNKIATIALDRTVRFYDTRSGRKLGAIDGLPERFANPLLMKVRGTVTPDGKQLWVVHPEKPWDSLLRIDLAKRSLLEPIQLEPGSLIRDFAVSSDGSKIVAVLMGEDWGGRYGVFDASSGESLHAGPTMDVHGAVRLTANGEHFIAVSSSGVETRTVDDGSVVRSFEFEERRRGATAFVVSPDASTAYAGFLFDGAVEEFALDDGEAGFSFGEFLDSVNDLRLSPDGKNLLAASSDGSIRYLDRESGQEVLLPRGHQNRVQAVAFGQTGKHVISGTFDNEVVVWDGVAREVAHELHHHEYSVIGVAVLPDGTALSASNDNTLKVFDLGSGELRRTIEPAEDVLGMTAFAILSDGSSAITGHQRGGVQIWNVATGELAHELSSDTHDWVSSVAISTDRFAIGIGGYVYAFDHGKTAPVFVFAPEKDEDGYFDEDAAAVPALTFLPDGKLASGHGDGRVRVFDVGEKQQVAEFVLDEDGGWVTGLEASPDGRVLFGAVAAGVHSIGVADWKPVRAPITAVDGGVMAIDVDASGKVLLAGMTDGTLLRFELEKWK